MKKDLIIVVLVIVCAAVLASPLHLVASDDDDSHGGDIMYTVPLKAVLFSHTSHVGAAELECDTCHDDIFDMESLLVQENDDFTMEALYEGKYCGTCHDGSMAFASNTQCARCHIGVKGFKLLNEEGSPDAQE